MSKNILLADDSLTIQKVIELTFMDEDFQVASVGNGDEALQKLKQVRPDLVIADIHMPGANGYEVCRSAKELHAGVPVLLLVGTFEPFDEGEYKGCGADAYLKKPFDSQELLMTVENLLGAASPAASAGEEEAAARPEAAAAAPAAEAMEVATEREPAPATEAPAAAPGEVFPGLESAEPLTSPLQEVAAEPAPPSEPAAAEEAVAAAPEVEAEVEIESEREWEIEAEAVETAPGPAGFEEPPATTERIVVEEAGPEAEELEAQEEPPARPSHETAKLAAAEEEEEEIAAAEDYSFQLQDEEEVQVAEEAPAAPVTETELAAGGEPSAGERGLDGLSDEDVDRIARRCVELLSEGIMREVAWEVIPDLAELIIKDRLRELESQVE